VKKGQKKGGSQRGGKSIPKKRKLWHCLTKKKDKRGVFRKTTRAKKKEKGPSKENPEEKKQSFFNK